MATEGREGERVGRDMVKEGREGENKAGGRNTRGHCHVPPRRDDARDGMRWQYSTWLPRRVRRWAGVSVSSSKAAPGVPS